MLKKTLFVSLLGFVLFSCSRSDYQRDRAFLQKYTDVIELVDGDASILVVPMWQARIMSATPDGEISTGWINYDLISSGREDKHINAYGGMERLWIGPEGGQFSIYFPKGSDFNFENWQVPAFLDTESFDLISAEGDFASFSKESSIENWSGNLLRFRIDRDIKIYGFDSVKKAYGWDFTGIDSAVMTESINSITNTGDSPWNEESGMLSIWMLGMFKPSDSVVIVVPLRDDSDQSIVDNYFGDIPAENLIVREDVVFFKGDGKLRSKIGIPYSRAKNCLGSYDPESGLLTLVYYTLPQSEAKYVNSLWEFQDYPFRGDVINSYNDGPVDESGSQLGPFYELETSSPAAGLEPGETLIHIQKILHLTGSNQALSRISKSELGLSLDEIIGSF
ncbi:MAG: hypothetical protein JXR63_08760 [Spirochaetales bacterium]|nr:hypothetical protein [Spirochaetales bacterium]